MNKLEKTSNDTVRGLTFGVTVLSINRVIYSEGDRTAVVEIEGGVSKEGAVDWLVYSQTLLGWEKPHHLDEMSVEKRQEIFAAIGESLNLLQMSHRIV